MCSNWVAWTCTDQKMVMSGLTWRWPAISHPGPNMTPTTLILPPEQRNGWWYGRVIRRHHRAASGHGRVANLHHLTSMLHNECTFERRAHTIALMFVLGCNTEHKVPRIIVSFFVTIRSPKDISKICYTIFSKTFYIIFLGQIFGIIVTDHTKRRKWSEILCVLGYSTVCVCSFPLCTNYGTNSCTCAHTQMHTVIIFHCTSWISFWNIAQNELHFLFIEKIWNGKHPLSLKLRDWFFQRIEIIDLPSSESRPI